MKVCQLTHLHYFIELNLWKLKELKKLKRKHPKQAVRLGNRVGGKH